MFWCRWNKSILQPGRLSRSKGHCFCHSSLLRVFLYLFASCLRRQSLFLFPVGFQFTIHLDRLCASKLCTLPYHLSRLFYKSATVVSILPILFIISVFLMWSRVDIYHLRSRRSILTVFILFLFRLVFSQVYEPFCLVSYFNYITVFDPCSQIKQDTFG